MTVLDVNAREIGKRIRALRVSQSLTLRALAGQTELTASFLSQVERGMVNSSIESLRRIANSLGVTMVQLLDPAGGDAQALGAAPPAAAERLSNSHSPVIVRASQRPQLLLPKSGVTIEPLTSGRAGPLQVFMNRLAPGTSVSTPPLRESNEQFVYVLSGALRVTLAQADAVLECGDAITYDGNSVRSFACVGGVDVTWLCVITPPVF